MTPQRMDPRDEPQAGGVATVLALVVLALFAWLVLGGGGGGPR